ncbi:MAG: hypothetical protein WCI62_01370 [Erysipelotrichaceae bacterium]
MKRSKLLLLNNILGMVYMGLFFYQVSLIASSANNLEAGALAFGLTILIMIPHLFLIFLAILFGWIGFGFNRSGFALTSAILYCVGAAAMFPIFFYQIPMIIIGFIAYGQMLNRIKKQTTQAIQA